MIKKYISTILFLLSTLTYADVHYVSLTGAHTSPFDTWAKAATNIQAAINVALAGSTVIVQNASYEDCSQLNGGVNIPCITITNSISLIAETNYSVYINGGSSISKTNYIMGISNNSAFVKGFIFTNFTGGIQLYFGNVLNCKFFNGKTGPCIYAGENDSVKRTLSYPRMTQTIDTIEINNVTNAIQIIQFTNYSNIYSKICNIDIRNVNTPAANAIPPFCLYNPRSLNNSSIIVTNLTMINCSNRVGSINPGIFLWWHGQYMYETSTYVLVENVNLISNYCGGNQPAIGIFSAAFIALQNNNTLGNCPSRGGVITIKNIFLQNNKSQLSQGYSFINTIENILCENVRSYGNNNGLYITTTGSVYKNFILANNTSGSDIMFSDSLATSNKYFLENFTIYNFANTPAVTSNKTSFKNCIFWTDNFPTFTGIALSNNYRYCIIRNATNCPDIGIMNDNPLIADYDFMRLKSRSGRWHDTLNIFTLDEVDSPALDTGDPTRPFANEPIPNGGRVNMGYDGNTPYASKSVGGTWKYLSTNMDSSIKLLIPTTIK